MLHACLQRATSLQPANASKVFTHSGAAANGSACHGACFLRAERHLHLQRFRSFHHWARAAPRSAVAELGVVRRRSCALGKHNEIRLRSSSLVGRHQGVACRVRHSGCGRGLWCCGTQPSIRVIGLGSFRTVHRRAYHHLCGLVGRTDCVESPDIEAERYRELVTTPPNHARGCVKTSACDC